jgi:imidazolonepropionase-like amidohydrolase
MPPAAKDHYLVTESADRARAFVRKLRDAGAIGIKVHHQMRPELLRAIADEAHKSNLTVTGHLYVMGAREAVLAGIDGLDHSTGLSHSLSEAEKRPRQSASDFEAYYTEMEDYFRLDPNKYDELIEMMVQRGVIILPTLTSWWRVATDQADRYAREDAEFARLPELKYVPDDVREIWRTSDRYKAPTPEHLKRFKVGYRKTQDFLRRFRKAGGRVLPGSSTVESVPGLSLIRELELMIDLGYTPMEAIVATTRSNAEFMGIARELGTIEAGKLADLIIVNRNPLADIRNLKAIDTVMIGGRPQDLRYHPDHSIPIPRPKLTRPLWIERQIEEEQRRAAKAG